MSSKVPRSIGMERQQVLDSLMGIVLVYRFGNPSHEPWSEHEKKTWNEAHMQECQRVRFNPSEAKSFFERCGVSVAENVCPASLEERLVNRTIDIILEKRRERILRSSKEQLFCEPRNVDNRELYMVSTRSCSRMKEQGGKPFANEREGTRVAWAVDGHDIKKRGSNSTIDRSSLTLTSGGACMPNATDKNHSQNLDNPANQPFMEMLQVLLDHFGHFLANENEDDTQMFGYHDEKHEMMCLQLILAEAGKGEGQRGFHQDMWATTGAAIIGTTLLNSRAMTMHHMNTRATFSLPRRSAYVLSGAARYGTLWSGLKGEFRHCLHPFTKQTVSREAGDASTCSEEEINDDSETISVINLIDDVSEAAAVPATAVAALPSKRKFDATAAGEKRFANAR